MLMFTYLRVSNILGFHISEGFTYLRVSHIWGFQMPEGFTYLRASHIWGFHISESFTYLRVSHIWGFHLPEGFDQYKKRNKKIVSGVFWAHHCNVMALLKNWTKVHISSNNRSFQMYEYLQCDFSNKTFCKPMLWCFLWFQIINNQWIYWLNQQYIMFVADTPAVSGCSHLA